MNKLKSYAASKRGRDTLLCFGIVIIAYIIVQAAIAGGGISSQIKGLLVPCHGDLAQPDRRHPR